MTLFERKFILISCVIGIGRNKYFNFFFGFYRRWWWRNGLKNSSVRHTPLYNLPFLFVFELWQSYLETFLFFHSVFLPSNLKLSFLIEFGSKVFIITRNYNPIQWTKISTRDFLPKYEGVTNRSTKDFRTSSVLVFSILMEILYHIIYMPNIPSEITPKQYIFTIFRAIVIFPREEVGLLF